MSRTRSSFPDESVVTGEAAAFVPAMEALASRNPRRFRFRVALHLVLGYAMFLSAVFLALLISLLAVIAALASRVIWLVGAALGSFASGIALLQSLNVHIPHEAIAFFNRMAREDEMQRKIALERGNISPYDPVISHGLDALRIKKITSMVQTLEWVLEAYFFRKPTPLSPDQPLCLLALKPRRGFLIPAFHQGMTAFDQVAALNCYTSETRFLLLDGSQPTLEKKIRKLPDSLMFKR